MFHPMDLEANKQVVRIFAQAINARDWQRLDAVVHPDFVRHSHSAPPVRGREALKDYLRREFVIFPDGCETIEDLVAEGDKVAVRHGFCGTQRGAMGPYPPSGKVMTADYLAIYRIADGRILEPQPDRPRGVSPRSGVARDPRTTAVTRVPRGRAPPASSDPRPGACQAAITHWARSVLSPRG